MDQMLLFRIFTKTFDIGTDQTATHSLIIYYPHHILTHFSQRRDRVFWWLRGKRRQIFSIKQVQ